MKSGGGKDGEGHILYRIVNVTDITGRVQAQEGLRAATTRLEVLLSNIQAGVIVEDDGGQVVLANQAFNNMMGLTVPSASASTAATWGGKEPGASGAVGFWLVGFRGVGLLPFRAGAKRLSVTGFFICSFFVLFRPLPS